MPTRLTVNGSEVEVRHEGSSLLEVLRDQLGLKAAKDGCSPQGQCGCCTVWIDGAPRVACVTPARRVAGRSVTTLEGLDPELLERWTGAFSSAGASQCGFCTPGIIMRLAALPGEGPYGETGVRRGEQGPPGLPRHTLAGRRLPAGADAAAAQSGRAGAPGDAADATGDAAAAQSGAAGAKGQATGAVERALLAHLCRCTGWRTITEAASKASRNEGAGDGRDLQAAARRAAIEGGAAQDVGPMVARGLGGFADDSAPEDALVAVPDGAGGWAVGETLQEARLAAAKTQGRRSNLSLSYPLEVAPGSWDLQLRTTWVDPAYLETDASWCVPGGEPASPLGNGGAFGGKTSSPAPAAARELADRYGRPVKVLLSREDTIRLGPKRPPIAAGVRQDGSGVVRVVRAPGVAQRVALGLPRVTVEEIDVAGPPVSLAIRCAGWAEAAAIGAALEATRAASPEVRVEAPSGGVAWVRMRPGLVEVRVSCGSVLDEVVLRSYCVGASHMALSWVRSEGIAVDDDGVPVDLTVRSLGVLAAGDMPEVDVEIVPGDGPAVNGSDAVFAAVASAAWIEDGLGTTWPTRRGSPSSSR